MQIVIDIPDENYQVTLTKIMLACRGCSIIELPKGHGRLIDADALLETDRLIVDSMKCHYIPMMDIYDASTIIEADKEAQE